MKTGKSSRLILAVVLVFIVSYLVIRANSNEPSGTEKNLPKETQKSIPNFITGNNDPAKVEGNKSLSEFESGAVSEAGRENKDITLQGVKYNDIGNTNFNLMNDGLVAQQGNWLYLNLINIGPGSLYTSYLYRSMTDGETAAKNLIDNVMPRLINVVGEWIYYYNYSGEIGIYKVKTDGSSKTKLAAQPVRYLKVMGSWIYYTEFDSGKNQYRLFRMQLDGSSNTILSEDNPSAETISEKGIYYLVADSSGLKNTLYKMSLDGTGKVKLGEFNMSISSRSLCAYGDSIYFLGFQQSYGYSTLYRINTDGTSLKPVEDQINFYNISNDIIYYIPASNESNIYTMNLDGSNRKNITNNRNVKGTQDYSTKDQSEILLVRLNSINVTSDFIYCTCDTIGQQSTLCRIKPDGSSLKFLN